MAVFSSASQWLGLNFFSTFGASQWLKIFSIVSTGVTFFSSSFDWSV